MARAVPPLPSASALGGFWFVFLHAGHQFALWVSGVSAKEEIYLDGALVLQRRKVLLDSSHELAIDGKRFRIELSTKSVRKGAFQCLLYEGNDLVAGLVTEFAAKRGWRQRAFVILGSAAIVYATLKTGTSWSLAIGGVVAISLLSQLIFGTKSSYSIRSLEIQSGTGVCGATSGEA